MTEAKPELGDRKIEELARVVHVSFRSEGGTPGQDQSAISVEGLDGIVRLTDLCQHRKMPNFRGNEVRVLATEIDDGDAVVLRHGGSLPRLFTRRTPYRGRRERAHPQSSAPCLRRNAARCSASRNRSASGNRETGDARRQRATTLR